MPKNDNNKRKKPAIFNDFTEINQLIACFLEQMSKDFSKFEGIAVIDRVKAPVVFGVNVRMGSDGKPHIESFGNVKTDQQPKVTIEEEREPLIDVIEKSDETTVIAELPGVEERDIRLRATSNSLHIEAKGRTRSYNKTVRISTSIDPVAKEARFHNGILEVNFRKGPPTEKAVAFRVSRDTVQQY